MSRRELYEKLDKLNVCHRCKKNEQFQNRKFCPECLEYISLAGAKYYEKNIKPHPEVERARKKAYREKHKALGLCIRCPNPATHGVFCYHHSVKSRRNDIKKCEKQKRERRERGLIPEYRKEHNLCCFCGEPIDTTRHGRACSKCAEKMSMNGSKGAKKIKEMRGTNADN